MSDDEHDHAHDAQGQNLVDELRQLAEELLDRVEPALRRAAGDDGKQPWEGCSWCPVCAAAALLRGEQHQVLTALADHGSAMVVILREALSGVPAQRVPVDRPAPDTGEGAMPQVADDAANGKPIAGGFVDIPVTIKR